MENLDFARLRYEGENHPYTGHPAARSSMPELYYLLLMTILTSAEATEAQWVHLYRVAKGTGYAQDVRELLPSAHSITGEKIVECVESIRRDDLTNAFLLDAMLLYLLREEENAKLLEYIAGLCALMEIPSQTIKESIQAAKCIVSEDKIGQLLLFAQSTALRPLESYFYLHQIDGQVVDNLDDAIDALDKGATVITLLGAHINGIGSDFSNCIFTRYRAHISCLGCEFKEGSTSIYSAYFLGCIFHGRSASYYGSTSYCHKLYIEHCIFQQIANLNLRFSPYIRHCTFIRCSSEERLFSSIVINNGSIENSSFIDCHVLHGALIAIEYGTISNCKFIRCFSNSDGYQYIICANHNSKVYGCSFESCKTKKQGDNDYAIIHAYRTAEVKENTFYECITARNISYE